ncbi:MAG: hypothetical protein RMK29_20790 [Myxococcales bacterium]|nr:hypothetical protein [Myxococcota bacterium]MDW8284150.1 hypothetical protein [Myxococcales bacterium]
MITTAITAAIATVLAFFGIPPGPYVGVVWLGIKLLLIGSGVWLAMRALHRKRAEPAVLEVGTCEDRLTRR